jgi:predicted ATPase/class 3 adenylate cyclase
VLHLPRGTVTFLFTDIEGSTRLLSQLGDEYAGVLAEHHRRIREVLQRHGGIEMGTQGDSFAVVFTQAGSAVAAAADAQEALAPGPVRVRMGVHTGEPKLTDDGYVGLAVHQAARIAAAGHGGQVVISETTYTLLDGEYDLRDLGEQRLKDLDAPLRLFQLGRSQFPPLRSLSRPGFPAEPPRLVGRKRELGELLRMLGRERARLVTLTGPGGMGKTSLAFAAAAELVEAFDAGVAVVELAAIRDPALVLPQVAEALGGEGSAADQIGDRELLLVLDNVEQVIGAAPEIAGLLAAAPNLSLIVTSREPLRVGGEREFPVRPLSEAPAIELFRQRAEGVLPGFTAEYSQLAEICRRLDSLPLAIELAAARVKVLPTGELLNRLERRLPLLTGSRRDRPERQQTLRATIEWSFELLTAEEQRLFARLAVFRGGSTLDAAESVCDADLDTLASLVDKSLIRRDGARFAMLETIREYAEERLESSDEAAQIRRRHAGYFADIAEATQGEHLGPAQAELRERFRTEWDNVRSALDWCLDQNETELGLRLAGGLTIFWLDRNVAVEGERIFRELLAKADGVDRHVRGRALMTASTVAGVRGNLELSSAWSEEGLAEFRAVGSEEGVAWTLTNLAIAPLEEGRLDEARSLLEEAETLHVKHGVDGGVRRVRHLLGHQALAAGDFDRGRRLLRESTELSRAADDSFSAASSLHSLGDLELTSGRLEAAEASYREALALSWDFDADRLVCYSLAGLAAVAAERRDPERAALLWGFAEGYEQRLRFTMRRRSLYADRLEGLAGAHPEQRTAGANLGVDAAVRLALA